MKKQHFYIIYTANDDSAEKDTLQFKLVKTYINKLCINEANQCEAIEIHQLEEFRKFLMKNLRIYISSTVC